MAQQAPVPVDVQEFQFILHCRLKVFANEDNAVFSKPCSLVATASRFGLVFIGTVSPAFQVIHLKTIEKHTLKEGEIANYNRRIISVPSPPKHLAVNCDCTKLAVVVERNDCTIGLIYDVASMMKQELFPPIEIRLSPTPGVNVTETSWNPTIPNIFTACKSDGTLGLYELKETGVDINELPAESQATCMCWSPKGKQIAVGSHNGKITQYKPDLKAMKVVNAPPLEGSPAVIALQWISNYQFIALYKPQNADSGASLLVVDAPKTGDTIYTNYDDICYSYGNTRPPQFYTVFQPIWNVLMVASSNSMEVGVLGNLNDRWMLWILADSARAELPLSASKQETLPIGLAFDASATDPVIWGESSLPPAPYLLLLSHHGLLCCFRVINIKSGVASICQAPEPLADTSGLSQFTSAVPVDTPKEPLLKIPTPMTAPITPPRPVEATPQPSFPFSQSSASAAPKLPQVPLFSNPPTSLFGPGPQISFQTPKPESAFVPKPDSGSLFAPKAVPQASVTTAAPAKILFPTPSVAVSTTTAATTPMPTLTTPMPTLNSAAPPASPAQTAQSEGNVGQEDDDALFSKLIREECETLETELKTLLHKGRSLKIDLGSDTEAVELVLGADALEDFLKEVNETSAGQAAEVHSLKQGLIQTWAWYEDARSRFAQTQDVALETLLRIQQLDPVSQRYLADIQHMTFYLNSQLTQASRVLDEQWENFQDSCRKVVKLKIPTMETIYQTMVRQSAIHQRQQYILKDISSRIRAQRSKMSNPSLLISLNNADQLEKELRRLQLEPQHLLQAQYERVLQNQQRLTSSKVQKLSKLLLNREIIRVTYNKPKLSPAALKAAIQSTPPNKNSVEPSFLGAGLSPIAIGKHPELRTVDFIQSTPKAMPSAPLIEQKQNLAPGVTSTVGDAFKTPMPGISIKFTSTAPIGTPAPTTLGQVPVSSTTTGVKIDPGNTSAQFKFTTIPTTSVPSLSTSTSAPATNTIQLNLFDPVSTTAKVSSTPVSFTTSLISQAKSIAENNPNNQFTFSTSASTTKPSPSYGSLFSSAKPTLSTFSFSLTTNTAASTTSAKPLAGSTASSAFVPTTQLPFNFSAKIPVSTSASNLVSTSTTVSKSPAFVFGTTTSAFGSTKSDTGVTVLSQTATTGTATIPSTTSVTVVTNATSTTTSSIFSILKTSTTDTTPTSTAVSVPINLFKISGTETTAASSILQGFLAPKTIANVPVTQQTITESATVPSSEKIVPTSSTDKVTPAAIASSNQASQDALRSFASTVTKVSQPIGASTATPISAADGVAISLTKLDKESSIFGKITSTGSLFGNAVTITTTTPLLGTADSTTTVGSNFGAVTASTTGSFFGTAITTKGSLFDTAVTTIAVSTTGSIFGSATPTGTTTTGSIFGSPTPTSTTTTGSIFGSPTTTTTTATGSFFGSSTPTGTTATGSIFGSSTPTSTTVTGSIFGIPAVATTAEAIFSAPPTTSTTAAGSLFGSPVTTTTSEALFGTAPITTTAGSIFGAVGSQQGSFLSTTTSSTTAIFSAIPTATVSPTVFATSIATPTTSATTTSTPAFAIPVTTSGSIFGAVPTTSSSASPSVFNIPATTTGSIFGAAPATTSIFGSSGFGTTATAAPSVFPQPASTGSSVFGSAATSPVFGEPPKTTASGPFGSPPAFGTGTTNTFGSTTTASGSVFGQPAAFGSGSVFGAPVSSSTNTFGSSFSSGGSVFGAPNTTPSNFGTSQSSTFSFAAAAANVPSTNSAFGFSKPSSAFGFGGTPASTDSSSFSFGTLNVGPATTTANTGFGSAFGQSPNSNPFAKAAAQEQKPAFGGGSLFGTPTTTTSSSIFGGGSTSNFGSPAFGSSPGFGSPQAFAQQPAFGQGSFGGSFGSTSQPGPFSGGNQSVAQTGFGGFGQSPKPTGFGAAPVFGGSPTGFGSAPAFGGATNAFGGAPAFGSPQKAFGSPPAAAAATGAFGTPPQQENPTFANLATQNTLGFGSLAQQTQTNAPMSFSGGSSFSTWR